MYDLMYNLWYLVTGSNRRHSTCKEDATTAELTRHILGVTYGYRTRTKRFTISGANHYTNITI